MINNLKNLIWTKKTYKNFINYLISIQDIKYKSFYSSLINNKQMIGIRTNILKKLAKDIIKTNWKDFLELSSNYCYEEITLKGFVVSYLNLEFNEQIKYLDSFINDIDNWSSCDLIVSNLKILKINQDIYYEYLVKNLFSKNPWRIRFSIVCFINYYIDNEYINKILDLLSYINNNDYYVIMSIAWLISICFIKFKSQTLAYLDNNNLNKIIINKAIQKIKESKQVSKQDKISVNKYIIKN